MMNAQSGSQRLKAAMAGIVGMLGMTLVSPIAHAENREIRIINETGAALVEFYASNAGTSGWEEDMLGRDTLRSGGSFIANIDDGSGYCRFDFKGVFADGQTAVRYGVDVCRVEAFRFTSG